MGHAKAVLDQKQQDYICESTVLGRKTLTICKDLGIERHVLADYCFIDPLFSKRLQKSRELHTHDMVEELLTITDNCNSITDVHAARIKSENIKWASGKYIPSVYGENLNIQLNHSLDLSSVLLAAENRVLPILQAKLADSTPAIDAESTLISSSTTSISPELAEII